MTRRPAVPEVLPLVHWLYDDQHRPVESTGLGCCLHIVLDDDNTEDGHVLFCLDYARERGHVLCELLASILLMMKRTARQKLATMAYDGQYGTASHAPCGCSFCAPNRGLDPAPDPR